MSDGHYLIRRLTTIIASLMLAASMLAAVPCSAQQLTNSSLSVTVNKQDGSYQFGLVGAPSTLQASVGAQVDHLLAHTQHDRNTVINVRGAVVSMNQSFTDFGLGLIIAIVLVYLILMAQFASFIDPFIILLAIPPGITGVLVFLLITGTTLNVMSLMGVIMMTGIVVSNSILIVDVIRTYRREGMPIREAVALACRVRLRPILMTSLATILGLIPMALALEAGSEQYAPLARAIIGGLTVSVVVTVFLVPAAYFLIHRREENQATEGVQA